MHKGVSLYHGYFSQDPQIKVTVKIRDVRRAFSEQETHLRWLRNMNVFLARRWYSPFVSFLHEIIYDDSSYYMVMHRVNGVDLFEFFMHVCGPQNKYNPLLFRSLKPGDALPQGGPIEEQTFRSNFTKC